MEHLEKLPAFSNTKTPVVLIWIGLISIAFMMFISYLIINQTLQQNYFNENLKKNGYLKIDQGKNHDLNIYVKKETGEVLIGSSNHPLVPVNYFINTSSSND